MHSGHKGPGAFFMHTGTQRKYVIKPINRFADGCPAREQGEDKIFSARL